VLYLLEKLSDIAYGTLAGITAVYKDILVFYDTNTVAANVLALTVAVPFFIFCLSVGFGIQGAKGVF